MRWAFLAGTGAGDRRTLADFPRVAAVVKSLFALPAFAAAHPKLQLGALAA